MSYIIFHVLHVYVPPWRSLPSLIHENTRCLIHILVTGQVNLKALPGFQPHIYQGPHHSAALSQVDLHCTGAGLQVHLACWPLGPPPIIIICIIPCNCSGGMAAICCANLAEPLAIVPSALRFPGALRGML